MNQGRAGPVDVIIADDHAMVRAGLQRIIEGELGLRVTGQASDGATTLARLKDTPCDVLLLDVTMPPPCGPELIRRIRAQWPRLSILVVSMHNHPRMVRAVLDAGANGYVPKDRDPEVLLEALRRVANGGHFLEAALADSVLFTSPPTAFASLSGRELEVLRRLARGESNHAIARALFRSEKTISTHKANLMAKLGLETTADLVRYADQFLQSMPDGGA